MRADGHSHLMSTAMSGGTPEPPELAGPAFDRNPSPAYRWLRAQAPAFRLPLPGGGFAWLLTRFEDAITALADPRLSKRPDKASAAWQRSGMGLPLDHRPSLACHMINNDPPDHTRLRRLIAGAFAPRRMDALRARTQQVTDHLLDQLEARDEADLVRDLGYPLPITIICDLLGIPMADRAPIQQWVAVLDASDQHTTAGDLLAVTDAMEAFLADQVAVKRGDPSSDLLSDLVVQHEAGHLSQDEITSTAFLLLIGGHETTTALIGAALLAVLTEPGLADAARVDPELVPRIVEESLRHDTPVRNATWRFPTEPVTIAGQTMQPGDPILISVLAANRDPAVFDDPDTFDITRTGRHLAFGNGPHTCIGAALARMEGQIAISTVLRRFPTLRLTVPADQLLWWPSPIMRGLYTLPVTW